MSQEKSLVQVFSEKYVAAIEKEQAIRDSAFISDFDVIGKIKVSALTPKLFTILTLMKSPLVLGGQLTSESILSFLWVIKIKSPDENQTSFFETVILKEEFETIMRDIGNYFEDAFQDAPLVSAPVDNTIPYYSSMTTIVDYLASEYGWKEEDILNMPYKRLFQYIKLLMKKHNPEKVLFNKSDSIKSEMIQELLKGK